MKTVKTQVCVLGAGAGGTGAVYRLIKNGIKTVVIDKYPDFGGTQVFCGVDGWEPGVTLDGIHLLLKDELESVSFEYGKQWCRCSFKTMAVYCPYLSIDQIKGAVYTLRKKGIITKGRFNETKFDHTNWYSFTEYGKHLMEVG